MTRVSYKIWLCVISVALGFPATLRAELTDWTFSVPSNDGAFTASESVNSVSVLGDLDRLANNFLKFTVTSASGTGAPANGTIRYAVEVPGLALFSYPFLTSEKRIIQTAAIGVCPNHTWTGILLYSLWTGTSGTSTNVSSATVPAFGVFTWNPFTAQATVSDLRNLSAYGTLGGFASFNLAGTCSNGEIAFSGAGDRGGTLYLSDTQGGVYMTNTNRALIILPQKTILAAADLNGTYTMFGFDASAHTNIYPARFTISGGTSGTGDQLTDIDAGTTNTARTWAFSSISVNSPINGTFTATLQLEGGSSRNAVCAAYVRDRTLIFCAAQQPDDATMPMNFAMVSDSHPYTAGAFDTYDFGTGKVATSLGTGTDTVHGLYYQNDGKIVAGGYSANSFSAARYLRDGTLDTTFSTDGKVITDVVVGQTDRGQSVTVQSDGKVVVGGYGSNGVDQNFVIVRYATDGSLDTTFDSDGYVISSLTAGNDQVLGVTTTSSGRIVVIGYVTNANTDVAIAQYTSAGVLDTGFSTDGYDTRDIGTSNAEQLQGIALDSNGKYVTGGYDSGASLMMRYLTDGTLDTTFSTDGMVTTDAVVGQNDRGQELVIQSDGKIVLGGYHATATPQDDILLLRYLTDGTLDTTFDSDGIATLTASSTLYERLIDVAVQSDGKIVGVGFQGASAASPRDFLIARFTTSGAFDTTFNSTGYLITSMGTVDDHAYSVVIQPDRKILVGGHSTQTNIDYALMRFWP